MGHYTTYRRRGSAVPSTVILPTTLAPFLGLVFGQLKSATSSLPDPGSAQTLYQASSPGGPWEAYATATDWPTTTWGDLADFNGFLYRATETGNGINFLGESPPSNIVDLR